MRIVHFLGDHHGWVLLEMCRFMLDKYWQKIMLGIIYFSGG